MLWRTTKATFVATGIASAILLTSGCSAGSTAPVDSKEQGKPSASPAASADVLRVGTDPTHPPHDLLDKDGKMVGWENDLMVAIGTKLGMTVEYSAASFDALLPGLTSGRFDAVFANMGVTAERLKVVDMVTAFESGQAFLAKKGSGLELNTLDALCGVSVGVTRGSTQADLSAEQSDKCTAAGKPPVEIKVFQSGDQIILAVESGRVDTYWTAQPIAQYYATQPGSVLVVAGDAPIERSKTAIALPKGSELTEPVHKALQALIDDGTYGDILAKWHLEDNAITTSVVNPTTAK